LTGAWIPSRLCEQLSDSFRKSAAIPEDWLVKPAKKGGGTQYINPKNPHDRVSVMPGNPNSPNPAHREPCVKRMRDGQAFDKNGNPVDPNSPAAHIPTDRFRFRS